MRSASAEGDAPYNNAPISALIFRVGSIKRGGRGEEIKCSLKRHCSDDVCRHSF